MSAKYSEESSEPEVKNVGDISNHVLKSTGVMHDVCMLSKFIDSCKSTILEKICETPERPVMQIYEEVYNSTRIEVETLRNEEILENFISNMPTASSFMRSMYRTRREIIPSNLLI